MKTFDRADIRIAKSILNKADKIIPKLADIATRIEQIEEEYRRKCEEKKAQLESERESLAGMLGRLEGAMDMACECSLDEAREAIYNDADNVVADEDADEDTPDATNDAEDDNLSVKDEDEPVVDEDEPVGEVDKDEPVGEVDEDEPMGEVDEPAPEWNQEAKDDDDWNGFHSAEDVEDMPDDADDDVNEDGDEDDIPEPEDGLLWNVNDFFNN